MEFSPLARLSRVSCSVPRKPPEDALHGVFSDRKGQEWGMRARIFEANHARKPDKTFTTPSHDHDKVELS